MNEYRSTSSAIVLIALLLISVLVFLPSAVALDVSDETQITNTNENAENPRLAMDSEDNIHMVYTDRDGDTLENALVYRKVNAGGITLEGPLTLTTNDVYSHDMAVDQSDRVHVVMSALNPSTDNDDLFYVQLNVQGEVVVPLEMFHSGDRDSYDPAIDTDDGGNVYVTWADYEVNGIMWMKLSPSGSVAINPKRVSIDLGDSAAWWESDIAVDENGDSYIVWRQGEINQISGKTVNSIGFTYLSSMGSVELDPVLVMTDRITSFLYPRVDLDSGGILHMTCIQGDNVRGGSPVYARLDSDGVVLESTTLEDGSLGSSFDPDISVDPNDNVFLVYMKIDNRWNDLPNIYAAAYWDDDGAWEGPEQISSDQCYTPSVTSSDAFATVGFQKTGDRIHILTIGEVAANRPPVPAIGYSPPNPAVNEEVTFDGSASSDPDDGDQVTEYLFDYGNGFTSGWTTSATATYTYTSAGTYNARLRVKDSNGMESTSWDMVSVVVSATPSNAAPTAVLTADVTNVDEGQEVTFDGSASSDPDGTVAEYWLDFGDGQVSTWVSSAIQKHTYTNEGRYTALLKVRDREGKESINPATVTINVVHTNDPPTASITSITPNPAKQGQEVSFVGEAEDADGELIAYSWMSELAGPIGSTLTFTLDDLEPGIHEISFKVRDDEGAWSIEDSANLVVTANQPFQVEDQTVLPDILDTRSSVRFRALYTDADNDPPTIANIMVDDGGGYETFALEEFDATDTDYSDGKEYVIYLKTDTPGKYKYSFDFANAFHPSKKTEVVELTVAEPSGPMPAWEVVPTLMVVLLAAGLAMGRGRRRKV